MKQLTFDEVRTIENTFNYDKPVKELFRISKGWIASGKIDAISAKLNNDELDQWILQKSKYNPIGVYYDTHFITEYYEYSGKLYQFGYYNGKYVAVIICNKKRGDEEVC